MTKGFLLLVISFLVITAPAIAQEFNPSPRPSTTPRPYISQGLSPSPVILNIIRGLFLQDRGENKVNENYTHIGKNSYGQPLYSVKFKLTPEELRQSLLPRWPNNDFCKNCALDNGKPTGHVCLIDYVINKGYTTICVDPNKLGHSVCSGSVSVGNTVTGNYCASTLIIDGVLHYCSGKCGKHTKAMVPSCLYQKSDCSQKPIVKLPEFLADRYGPFNQLALACAPVISLIDGKPTGEHVVPEPFSTICRFLGGEPACFDQSKEGNPNAFRYICSIGKNPRYDESQPALLIPDYLLKLLKLKSLKEGEDCGPNEQKFYFGPANGGNAYCIES